MNKERLLEVPVMAKSLFKANSAVLTDYLQRRAMNQFETSCFIVFAWLLTETGIPSEKAMAETIIAQDFLERQNFSSDEQGIAGPVWIDSYPMEYQRLMANISRRYDEVFSPEEAQVRKEAVARSTQEWFEGNTTIETYVRVGTVEAETCFKENVKRIETAGLNSGLVHKEEVDALWISAVLAFLYEGDEGKMQVGQDSLLPLTMLYQLAEDYANYSRDQRVNKITIFTSLPEGQGVLDKIKYMGDKLRSYLKQVNRGWLFNAIVVFGWTVKTAIARLKSIHSVDEWRAKKDYDLANELEDRRFSLV